MVVARPASSGFEISEAPGFVTVTTPKASAIVDVATGNVSFRNAAGEVVLAESGAPVFAPTSAEGQAFLAITQQFNRGTDEGFYGLGQHQNRQMNYNGEDVELAQHNMDIAVPFVVSTRNYGAAVGQQLDHPLRQSEALRASSASELKVTGETASRAGRRTTILGEREARDSGRKRRSTTSTSTIRRSGRKRPRRRPYRGDDGPEHGGQCRRQAVRRMDRQPSIPTTTRHSQVPALFLELCEGLRRRQAGARPLAAELEPLVPQFRPADDRRASRSTIRIEWEPNAGYIALLHNDPLPEPDRHSLSLSSDVAKALDYYFVAGDNMDGVIAGYRDADRQGRDDAQMGLRLLAEPPALQHAGRNRSACVREYRKRKLPIDNIVQDWFYWPEDSWGCHCFDAKRFPDPQAMVDEVHALQRQRHDLGLAEILSDDRELQGAGRRRRVIVAGRAAARGADRRRIEAMTRLGRARLSPTPSTIPTIRRRGDSIRSRSATVSATKGFDAWWLDSDEPDFHSNLSIERAAAADGPDRDRSRRGGVQQLSAGAHGGRLFESARRFKPDVRPFILTPFGLRRHPADQRGPLVGRRRRRAGTICATRSRRA